MSTDITNAWFSILISKFHEMIENSYIFQTKKVPFGAAGRHCRISLEMTLDYDMLFDLKDKQIYYLDCFCAGIQQWISDGETNLLSDERYRYMGNNYFIKYKSVSNVDPEIGLALILIFSGP